MATRRGGAGAPTPAPPHAYSVLLSSRPSARPRRSLLLLSRRSVGRLGCSGLQHQQQQQQEYLSRGILCSSALWHVCSSSVLRTIHSLVLLPYAVPGAQRPARHDTSRPGMQHPRAAGRRRVTSGSRRRPRPSPRSCPPRICPRTARRRGRRRRSNRRPPPPAARRASGRVHSAPPLASERAPQARRQARRRRRRQRPPPPSLPRQQGAARSLLQEPPQLPRV